MSKINLLIIGLIFLAVSLSCKSFMPAKATDTRGPTVDFNMPGKALDVKVSVNDVIVKAAAVALRNFPKLNVQYDNGNILQLTTCDVGVAVAIAARGFAQRHLDDCAMLRVLGLSQKTIASAYAIEFGLAESDDPAYDRLALDALRGVPSVRLVHSVGSRRQLRALRRELVDSGRMTERDFHNAVMQGGSMPIEMVRARLLGEPLPELLELSELAEHAEKQPRQHELGLVRLLVDDPVAVRHVRVRRLTHAGQEQLDAAVAGARKRDIGRAGMWGWDRVQPDVDISGLVASTVARVSPPPVGPETTTRTAHTSPRSNGTSAKWRSP